MSEDFNTAFVEYQQDLGTRPGTFCAYRVHCQDVADLTDPEAQRALGCTKAALLCPWKEVLLVQKATPPTWTLAQKLIGLGFVGARVPSARRSEGVNLVLWRWNHTPLHRVEPIDLNFELPRNQKSWQQGNPTPEGPSGRPEDSPPTNQP
jgi:RES domain-containing protein